MTAEPAAIARALVAENHYLIFATAAADGAPWASHVWYAPRGFEEWGRAQLLGTAYRAIVREAFVLDDHDERVRV